MKLCFPQRFVDAVDHDFDALDVWSVRPAMRKSSASRKRLADAMMKSLAREFIALECILRIKSLESSDSLQCFANSVSWADMSRVVEPVSRDVCNTLTERDCLSGGQSIEMSGRVDRTYRAERARLAIGENVHVGGSNITCVICNMRGPQNMYT